MGSGPREPHPVPFWIPSASYRIRRRPAQWAIYSSSLWTSLLRFAPGPSACTPPRETLSASASLRLNSESDPGGRALALCWSYGRAVWFLRGAKGRLGPLRVQDATRGLQPPSGDAARRPRRPCRGMGAPGSDLPLPDPLLVGCPQRPGVQPMGVPWVDILARVAGDDVTHEAMAGARLPRHVCRQDAGREGAGESERRDERLRPPRTHQDPTLSSLAAPGHVAVAGTGIRPATVSSSGEEHRPLGSSVHR